MMGRLEAQEPLFYRFRIEDHVPGDHLLRRIDRHLDLESLRPEFEAFYSRIGRPSIDPELMIRMLLIGYLYGIRSETRLCEEVHLNIAYRWFCRLGLEGRVPDRSTFSKNRHGRFADGDMLRRVFESVVERCVAFGLVGGTGAAVDGSTVFADANRERRGTPEEMHKLWNTQDDVSRPVRAYLDQLAEEAAAPNEGPDHKPPKAVSETDPQAAWSVKDGPARFSYETNYLIDTDNGIIVDVEATPARLSQEIVAAKAMLERSADRHDFRPDALAADGSYGTGSFLAWLLKRDIAPHVPVLDRRAQNKGKLEQTYFDYDPEADIYICPEGATLRLRSTYAKTRTKRYLSDPSDCADCEIRKACADGSRRTITRHMDEDARQVARDLSSTDAYAVSRRKRKKVEMLFAHLKRHLGLTRLRLRGLSGATEEFTLAATAQNLKRLAKTIPI